MTRRIFFILVLLLAVASLVRAGTVTYTYDAFGQVINAQYDIGMVFLYEYDAIGNRIYAEVDLPSQDVVIRVRKDDETVLDGLNTYAFTDAGQYTGIHGQSDDNGEVFFSPQNFDSGDYKFRVDYLKEQYWSDAVTIPGVQYLDVVIPHVNAAVNVARDGIPMPGVKVYVFNDVNQYLGINGTTDEEGNVIFELPQDKSFKFRVDYLGSQIWSNDILLNQNMTLTVAIPHRDVCITVQGQCDSDQTLKDNVRVYLFTPADRYLGEYRNTDYQGMAYFNLPGMDFKVRADYMKQQYWSEVFNWTDQILIIEEGIARLTVNSISGPVEGVRVYAFTNTGSYLSLNDITDADGQADFILPQGDYRFRADYMGSQYFSDTLTVIPHVLNPVFVSTGGGTFTLTLEQNNQVPLAGVSTYLFSGAGSYLGKSGNTDDQGRVDFNLADGSYKIRVDYMGYNFWTDPFTLPDVTSLTLTIPHQDVAVDIAANFNQTVSPAVGVKTYLFTSSGKYMSQFLTTDDQGRVVYSLPEREYQVRADYMKQQYWTDPFFWADREIIIEHGQADVTVRQEDTPIEQARVYVFTDTDQYLNLSSTTDAQGMAGFILPAGTYKFRADFLNNQYWATSVIQAHSNIPVDINTGGGPVTVQIEREDASPMSDISVYAFTASQSYTGKTSQTDNQGAAAFSLSDGEYTFRADYLGNHYWSDVLTVPDSFTTTLTIDHQPVTLVVNERYNYNYTPLEGIKIYLFKDSQYMGLNSTTNSSGQVSFLLPNQEYRFRADYLKSRYWTDPIQWQDTELDIPNGKVILTVAEDGTPLENVSIYLFTPDGAYLSRTRKTDSQGRSEFIIPANNYKFRIDYGGAQHWTDLITIEADQEVAHDINL